MKNAREARTDLIKTADLTKPITLEVIGSDDDPCFGKLNNPGCEECQRCGDAEICSIVQGQLNHINRNLQEKKTTYKDLEEEEIPEQDPKVIRKKIKTRIRELIKMAGKEGISRENIVADIHATYVVFGISKKKVERILDRLTDVTDSFIYTLKTDTYTWKKK